MIKDNRKVRDTYEGLRDNKEEVLLDDNKYILKPIWKKDVDCYIQRVRGYSLWAIENQDIRYKKKLEKSISQT